MKHLSDLGVLLLGGMLLWGCKQSVTSPPATGAPGDIISTSDQLYVLDTLYQQITDRSGVKISLEGTPYSAISDASGNWQLANIPAGTYTIQFTKENCVSTTRQNFIFGGNGTYYYGLYNDAVVVYPIPTLFPNLVLRPFDDLLEITTRDTVIHPGGPDTTSHRTLYDTVIMKNEIASFSSRSQYFYHGQRVSSMLFFGSNENIDPGNPSSYSYSISSSNYNYQDTLGIAIFTVYRSVLLESGFTPGATIYCAAYANIASSLDSWYDQATNKRVYSGFSPHHSEVRSFVLP